MIAMNAFRIVGRSVVLIGRLAGFFRQRGAYVVSQSLLEQSADLVCDMRRKFR